MAQSTNGGSMGTRGFISSMGTQTGKSAKGYPTSRSAADGALRRNVWHANAHSKPIIR